MFFVFGTVSDDMKNHMIPNYAEVFARLYVYRPICYTKGFRTGRRKAGPFFGRYNREHAIGAGTNSDHASCCLIGPQSQARVQQYKYGLPLWESFSGTLDFSSSYFFSSAIATTTYVTHSQAVPVIARLYNLRYITARPHHLTCVPWDAKFFESLEVLNSSSSALFEASDASFAALADALRCLITS